MSTPIHLMPKWAVRDACNLGLLFHEAFTYLKKTAQIPLIRTCADSDRLHITVYLPIEPPDADERRRLQPQRRALQEPAFPLDRLSRE